MSTWISKALVALITTLALGGCQLVGAEGEGGRPAPASVSVSGGDVTLQGPQGYCVDLDASTLSAAPDATALLVFSECAFLAGALRPRAAPKALLTAAVARAGPVMNPEVDGAALEQFFRSAQGRAALSRSGRAATVEVSEVFVAEGALFLRLSDNAPFAGGAVATEYWRTLYSEGDRIVTLSALGFAARPIDRSEGVRLMRAFLTNSRSASTKASGLRG